MVHQLRRGVVEVGERNRLPGKKSAELRRGGSKVLAMQVQDFRSKLTSTTYRIFRYKNEEVKVGK